MWCAVCCAVIKGKGVVCNVLHCDEGKGVVCYVLHCDEGKGVMSNVLRCMCCRKLQEVRQRLNQLKELVQYYQKIRTQPPPEEAQGDDGQSDANDQDP